MKVLAPVDGSDCSFRALAFATEFVRRYEGELHVVHITDYEDDTTEDLIDEVEGVLDEAGIADDPEIRSNMRMSKPKYADKVGEDILEIADEEGYDHVVMGSHGAGAVKRMILGSAAETVVRAADVPTTIIP